MSADIDALDGFVDGGSAARVEVGGVWEQLDAQRRNLLASALPAVVEVSSIPPIERLLVAMADNEIYVATVADSLRRFGLSSTDGLIIVSADVIAAALGDARDDRLDDLERSLVAGGIDEESAAELRDAVDALLSNDPGMSFDDAVLAAAAAKRDMSVEELERSLRAFSLGRVEAVDVVAAHFDDVAGRTGSSDQITLEDLQAVIDDETTPPELVDAAYRLAVDSVLFQDLDSALVTDFVGIGRDRSFDWSSTDGILGRDDFDVFGQKDFHHRLLSTWGPLLDTADRGYDLGRADGHIGVDGVIAFVEDRDIPLYVRLGVFDVYQSPFGLDLELRNALVDEWAFANPPTPYTSLHVSARPPIGTIPMGVSLPPAPGRGAPPRGPAGGGAGAGVGGAVLAAAIMWAGETAWSVGRHELASRGADPHVAVVDGHTGRTTRYEIAELVGLSPEETKAWFSYVAATGHAPDHLQDRIGAHPYLDARGQWRWSDTNHPIHDIHPDRAGEPLSDNPLDFVHSWESFLEVPDLVTDEQLADRGLYRDRDGKLKYCDTAQAWDGINAAPADREELLTSADLDEMDTFAIDGVEYQRHQVVFERAVDALGQPIHSYGHWTLGLEMPELYEVRVLGDGGHESDGSRTVLEGEGRNAWHLDVENAPCHIGQLHLQIKIGDTQHRYIYDFHSGTWLPDSDGNEVDDGLRSEVERHPRFETAMRKAREDLNVPPKE